MTGKVLTLVVVVASERHCVLSVLWHTRIPAANGLPWRVSRVRVGGSLLFVVVVAPVEAFAVVVGHVGRESRAMRRSKCCRGKEDALWRRPSSSLHNRFQTPLDMIGLRPTCIRRLTVQ